MRKAKTRRTFLAHFSAGLLGFIGVSHLFAASAARSIPVNTKEQPDDILRQKLETLIRHFRGDMGIYVRHLVTGQSVALRADELFPTASMIKVAIMTALFDRMNRGELTYHQKLVYDGSSLYRGMHEDILASFKIGEHIKLSKLIMLMITISDNTAAIWCQELAGTGTHINEVLDAHGLRSLRINSRTPDREEAYKQYGWGQTTPREMCELLTLIRQKRAVSPSASEEMYRILTRIYWSGEALSQIPPYVQAASKQGALNRSRSEVVLVNASSGDYVFCVITRNQEDQSWGHDNEGFVLLRDVSRTLWRHFEPEYEWEPAPSMIEWNR